MKLQTVILYVDRQSIFKLDNLTRQEVSLFSTSALYYSDFFSILNKIFILLCYIRADPCAEYPLFTNKYPDFREISV